MCNDLLKQLGVCIERGKADAQSPHPADLKGQPGAAELTAKLLSAGVAPGEILQKAMIPAMKRLGDRFSQGLVFIPDLIIAAKAMKAAMQHLKPYFEAGEVQKKGTFVLGTVKGDLHDIGKNLVGMVLEGNGYRVIDLGVNVSSDRFLQTVEEHPDCRVGLSALLTTTMLYMDEIVKTVKSHFPQVPIFIGGAPVTPEFNQQIGANGYFPDPQQLVNFLETK
ncbi:cobalamin B12-binding domain protein [Caldithrix abyssi DSM 13497]|uniref:Cobalamin B12-binding domain protein n=1 Tax=Caldithrix abyssi DSM 13497 TaxID=880073 RepID=H1XNC8_CALAY|nr:cobalamin-dependent protein [Caldithrix abyssi]APF18053.1 Methanogenic corrinoid protein MtbC1 [Caldithrix abyssi DSM 13497]EHO42099.1 cobalamin B12-binding domain protein [Caldithrix abyssi DSM 13497]